MQAAQSTFLKMFGELQKLKTPVNEQVVDDSVKFMSFFVYVRLAGDKENAKYFFKHVSNTGLQFNSHIKKLLVNEMFRGDSEMLHHILNDEDVVRCCGILEKEIKNGIWKTKKP